MTRYIFIIPELGDEEVSEERMNELMSNPKNRYGMNLTTQQYRCKETGAWIDDSYYEIKPI